MLALLGSLLGFLSSVIPDVFRLLHDRADRRHELKILEMQLKQQRLRYEERLEEIRTAGDVAETRALYATFHSSVSWVEALNGTVRPVLAYAFFLLYASVKLMQFLALSQFAPGVVAEALWQEEDKVIFAGIISFYFGQRAMQKVRQGK